jgi:hypothetical protein
MRKRFEFEFDDESAAVTGERYDRITFPRNVGGESLNVEVIDGSPTVIGNRDGLLKLAKILVQMALSDYQDGFHLHLYQDFNAYRPDALTVALRVPSDSSAPSFRPH